MSRRIFFGRHGHRHGDDTITPRGMEKLLALRERLARSGFQARFGISSGLNRTNETARFLTYGLEPTIVPALHGMGDLTTVGLVVGKNFDLLWLSGIEYAVLALDAILPILPDAGDTVVIGHDCGSILLARRYIELQGVTVLSDFDDNSFPDQGEGVLVEGTKYTLFRH